MEFVQVGRPITRENVIPATALKEGGTYEVILTTSMGLVRYRLHDVVLCKGFFGRSPVLEFLRKSGNLISIGQVRFNEQDLLTVLAAVPSALPERWSFGKSPEGDRLVLYVSSRRELDASFDLHVERLLLRSHWEYKAESHLAVCAINHT